MKTFETIEAEIETVEARAATGHAPALMTTLVACGEQVLEQWIVARGETPTAETREGFRLLALHRQGSKGEPSFNACRETCRELAYHYNLVAAEPDHADTPRRIALAALVVRHLLYFVSGKLEVVGLGDFCCAAKPVRRTDEVA